MLEFKTEYEFLISEENNINQTNLQSQIIDLLNKLFNNNLLTLNLKSETMSEVESKSNLNIELDLKNGFLKRLIKNVFPKSLFD